MTIVLITLLCVCFCLCIIISSLYNDLRSCNEKYNSEVIKFQMATFGVKETESGIKNFLETNETSKIAIYGVGALFNIYKNEIERHGKKQIVQYIDQNDTRKEINGIPLVRIENIDKKIDIIVVSVVYNYEGVVKLIRQYSNATIIPISDIVYYLGNNKETESCR